MGSAAIAVIGSINMDVVNTVRKHPLPGETIHGLGTSYHAGGKGANQAVAAAKSGARVWMAGAVGTDGFGAELLAGLAAYGLHTEAVLQKDGTSGLAFITVDASGENNIILSSGANGKLAEADLEQVWPSIDGCSAVLLQNEIPWETSLYAMKRAAAEGKRVYFNPAPAFKLPAEAFPYIHCLVLNETEAEAITGASASGDAGEQAALDALLGAAGLSSVVLTLGGKGAVYADRDGTRLRLPAFKVQPVDTTAAGDTFIGAFAARREAGETVERSLRFASAAAGIAVTKAGAQQSVPSREEVEAFMSERE